MKALVYHGPGQRSWDTVPDPTLQDPTDVIVRIDSSTICGTDLHILKGDVPEVNEGTILGHEAVGTIVEIGSAVTTLAAATACSCRASPPAGAVASARKGTTGSARAAVAGSSAISSTALQAEYARVPFADTSVYKVPARLSRRAGSVPRRHPADGLRGRSPERPRRAGGHGRHRRRRPDRARHDHDREAVHAGPHRRRRPRRFSARKALDFGATSSSTTAPRMPSPRMELTEGLGADVAIEAVGVPGRSSCARSSSDPAVASRTSASTGIRRRLHLEKLWIRDVTITTGLVDTFTTPKLLRRSRAGGSTRPSSRRTASPWRSRWRPTTCSQRPPRRTR